MNKKGRIYFKFLVAAAVLLALAYSAFVLAASPSIVPGVVTDLNATGFQTAENVTVALAGEQLFFYANYSDDDLDFEENSTFKCYKRSLYQPQNRSLAGYWKLDGNEVIL